MLIRQHISLKEWQVEYLAFLSKKKLGVNASQIIRSDLSIVTIAVAIKNGYVPAKISPCDMFCPNKKSKKHKKCINAKRPSMEDLKRLGEELDHEGRMAADYLMKKR